MARNKSVATDLTTGKELVTVNRATGTYKFTLDYYVMKHASHYVLPGAKMIKINGTFTDALVFQNTDKSIVIIAANKTDKTENVNLKISKKSFYVSLASNSLNTLLLK